MHDERALSRRVRSHPGCRRLPAPRIGRSYVCQPSVRVPRATVPGADQRGQVSSPLERRGAAVSPVRLLPSVRASHDPAASTIARTVPIERPATGPRRNARGRHERSSGWSSECTRAEDLGRRARRRRVADGDATAGGPVAGPGRRPRLPPRPVPRRPTAPARRVAGTVPYGRAARRRRSLPRRRLLSGAAA